MAVSCVYTSEGINIKKEVYYAKWAKVTVG